MRCDPRSDIFALGAILYQLATGRLPFGHPDYDRRASRERLYRDPLPPRALVPTTPPWLQEIILRCLEIDARERYRVGRRASRSTLSTPGAGRAHRARRAKRAARACGRVARRRMRAARIRAGTVPAAVDCAGRPARRSSWLAPAEPDRRAFARRCATRRGRAIAADAALPDRLRHRGAARGGARPARATRRPRPAATSSVWSNCGGWAKPLRLARRARDLPRARVGEAGGGARSTTRR